MTPITNSKRFWQYVNSYSCRPKSMYGLCLLGKMWLANKWGQLILIINCLVQPTVQNIQYSKLSNNTQLILARIPYIICAHLLICYRTKWVDQWHLPHILPPTSTHLAQITPMFQLFSPHSHTCISLQSSAADPLMSTRCCSKRRINTELYKSTTTRSSSSSSSSNSNIIIISGRNINKIKKKVVIEMWHITTILAPSE